MQCFRILLADDHEVVLEGLRRILNRPEFEVVGAVKDGRALVNAAAQLLPDIIIADVSMPQLNGVEAVRQICKTNPKPRIIFLSMHPETAYALEALNAGGMAYVLKNSAGEDLLDAIREARQGRMYISPPLAVPVMRALHGRRSPSPTGDRLTVRQREVLQLMAEGKAPKEISGILNISNRTVEFHKYRIMSTLGLGTMAELVAYAVKKGMVS